MHILIVDDETEIQFILYKHLERAGYRCWVASNGAEALELNKIIKFDVVISDWRMPVMNGVELCKKIRQVDEEKGTYTYFIFLTAMCDRQYCLHGLRAGANDYLYKPIDRHQLKLKLKNAEMMLGHANELELENFILATELRLDPLTKLGNRRKLDEDTSSMRELVRRYDHSYAFVLFDLDHFKKINDEYGHKIGDQVLVAVSQALQEQLRQSDWVYRYGGEEFLLALPEQNKASVRKAIQRILDVVGQLKLSNGKEDLPIRITMSAGVSFLNQANPDPEAVFIQADQALYAAKVAGRNQLHFFAKC